LIIGMTRSNTFSKSCW